MSSAPRVRFIVRRPAGDGRSWYEGVTLLSWDGGYGVTMPYPPAIGDLISLWDRDRPRQGLPPLEGGPVFRVVERMWMHASYGSADWPYGETEARSGPLLDIFVEPAGKSGYSDETDNCAESACEAIWVNGAWWMPPGADEPDPHEHHPAAPE